MGTGVSPFTGNIKRSEIISAANFLEDSFKVVPLYVCFSLDVPLLYFRSGIAEALGKRGLSWHHHQQVEVDYC